MRKKRKLNRSVAVRFDVEAVIHGPLSDYVTVGSKPTRREALTIFQQMDARYRYVKLVKVTVVHEEVKYSDPGDVGPKIEKFRKKLRMLNRNIDRPSEYDPPDDLDGLVWPKIEKLRKKLDRENRNVERFFKYNVPDALPKSTA